MPHFLLPSINKIFKKSFKQRLDKQQISWGHSILEQGFLLELKNFRGHTIGKRLIFRIPRGGGEAQALLAPSPLLSRRCLGSSFGCKNLLNFTTKTMKFHNHHHNKEHTFSLRYKQNTGTNNHILKSRISKYFLSRTVNMFNYASFCQ